MSRNRRQVRCMDCGDRYPRTLVIAIYDEAGQLIGYMCRSCHQ